MASCPSCELHLKWWLLRRRFHCPSCGEGLSANTGRAGLVSLVLWVLLDIPISLVYALVASNDSGFFFVRTVLSGALGLGLAALVLSAFTSVEKKA